MFFSRCRSPFSAEDLLPQARAIAIHTHGRQTNKVVVGFFPVDVLYIYVRRTALHDQFHRLITSQVIFL
jgi:hypothetical protein